MPRLLPALLPLLAALLPACTPPPREPVFVDPPPVNLPATVAELTPDEAEQLMTASPGLVVLDVRGETEAQQDGRIPGARLYDYLNREESFKQLDTLDRQAPYLIYCAIGGRAKLTAAHLHEAGFTKLSVLKGGVNAWIAAGKPVQK